MVVCRPWILLEHVSDGTLPDLLMLSSTEDGEPMTKRQLAQARRALLMKLFADTGTAKIGASVQHVTDILDDETALETWSDPASTALHSRSAGPDGAYLAPTFGLLCVIELYVGALEPVASSSLSAV